jgi:Na+-driven multidrug efflux pump
VAALVFSAAMVAVFAVYARPLVALFIEDAGEGVLAAGDLYLSVAALGQPLACFCLGVTGGINGTGKVVPPMLIDTIGYVGLLLPAEIVAASVLSGVDLSAIWWIFVAANSVLAIAYWVYVQRVRWLAHRSCQSDSEAHRA